MNLSERECGPERRRNFYAAQIAGGKDEHSGFAGPQSGDLLSQLLILGEHDPVQGRPIEEPSSPDPFPQDSEGCRVRSADPLLARSDPSSCPRPPQSFLG